MSERLALFSFTGRSTVSLADAIVEATHHADDWLATHQWRGDDGRSSYTHSATAHTIDAGDDEGVFYYVIHLIGPTERTSHTPSVLGICPKCGGGTAYIRSPIHSSNARACKHCGHQWAVEVSK